MNQISDQNHARKGQYTMENQYDEIFVLSERGPPLGEEEPELDLE